LRLGEIPNLKKKKIKARNFSSVANLDTQTDPTLKRLSTMKSSIADDSKLLPNTLLNINEEHSDDLDMIMSDLGSLDDMPNSK
jgi:hypothetical protein